MSKAKEFLAAGTKIEINGKEFEIKKQTIRHNLKFIAFITDVIKEANEVGKLEFSQENISQVILNSIEDKLLEVANLIVPEATEADVLDSYFDDWAEALEVYLKINFSRVFQAVKMARNVQQTKK